MGNLLLLHGALGAASTLEPLAHALQSHFQVHLLDFTGHGGRAFPQEPFSMQLFVQDILQLLPATRHPLEAVSVDKLSQEVRQFISQIPV